MDNLNKRLNSVDSDAKSGSIIFEQEVYNFSRRFSNSRVLDGLISRFGRRRWFTETFNFPVVEERFQWWKRTITGPGKLNHKCYQTRKLIRITSLCTFRYRRKILLDKWKQIQIVEREDTLRLTQQQLMDTKQLNADLYDKLRLAEDQVQKLEKDFLWQKEIHNQVNDFEKNKTAHFHFFFWIRFCSTFWYDNSIWKKRRWRFLHSSVSMSIFSWQNIDSFFRKGPNWTRA